MSVSNPNKTTVETFWTDLIDTQSGLYATYAVLRNDYVLNIREEAWRSDLCWPGYGRPQPQSNAEGWNWYCQLYTNSTNAVSNKWDALYIGVWRANQVIEALDRIKSTVDVSELETWNQQMGQARFMRGLMYFYLHSSFNNGSVVLRKSTEDPYNLPLSPSEDVLKFFREDLQAAFELLPSPDNVPANYTGLPTKGTAATIQGVSFLYEKEYEEAEKKFKDVIDNYGYELEQDWEKMFTNDGEFNSESIFEISYSLDYRQDITTWDNNCMYNRLASMSTTLAGFLPAAWLVNEFLNDKPDALDTRNSGRKVSLRASSMVALVQDDVTPYYMTGNAAENCAMGGPQGDWGFGKFKNILTMILLQRKSLQCLERM
ncbi:RagB/SusD family nutrient uptake outer membrane protein [Bacteroides thetaiotaomicron]|nr:RagB/SusD family nutrient uptake outer membrane protein [Bacteroides thetaiotaomicron]